MAKEMYGGPVNKHQQLAQTGHAEGYAKGGSVSHSSGGHKTMKSKGMHHGFDHHGHKGPHEHYMHPGHHHEHSGHNGHSVHSLVHAGKNPEEHVESTHTMDTQTDGGGDQSSPTEGRSGSTGGTRNRF